MLVLLLGEEAGPIPAAAAVFGIAALTDAADGHIARSRNLVTKFGRIADPLADKLLVGTALDRAGRRSTAWRCGSRS